MADGPRTTEQLVVRPGDEPGGVPGDGPAPEVALLEQRDADAFLRRWSDVQARFVDDPQGALREGDGLVAEVLRALGDRFAAHHDGLEQQWRGGREPDTEQLRLALQSYRSVLTRLLSA